MLALSGAVSGFSLARHLGVMGFDFLLGPVIPGLYQLTPIPKRPSSHHSKGRSACGVAVEQ